MKPYSLLKINIVLASLGFIIIAVFDYPVELIGAALVGWVTISNLEMLRKLRKAENQRRLSEYLRRSEKSW